MNNEGDLVAQGNRTMGQNISTIIIYWATPTQNPICTRDTQNQECSVQSSHE